MAGLWAPAFWTRARLGVLGPNSPGCLPPPTFPLGSRAPGPPSALALAPGLRCLGWYLFLPPGRPVFDSALGPSIAQRGAWHMGASGSMNVSFMSSYLVPRFRCCLPLPQGPRVPSVTSCPTGCVCGHPFLNNQIFKHCQPPNHQARPVAAPAPPPLTAHHLSFLSPLPPALSSLCPVPSSPSSWPQLFRPHLSLLDSRPSLLPTFQSLPFQSDPSQLQGSSCTQSRPRPSPAQSPPVAPQPLSLAFETLRGLALAPCSAIHVPLSHPHLGASTAPTGLCFPHRTGRFLLWAFAPPVPSAWVPLPLHPPTSASYPSLWRFSGITSSRKPAAPPPQAPAALWACLSQLPLIVDWDPLFPRCHPYP